MPPKHVMIPTAISEPYLYTESKSIFIYFKNSLIEAFYTAVGSWLFEVHEAEGSRYTN